MTFEDDDSVEIPAEMYGSEDEAVLAPVFVGHRMEAELIRSLLEAHEIPAVVFGEGAYAFGSDNVSPSERVMVRSDHVAAALEAIRQAEPTEGEIVQPTADDLEVMVGEDYEVDEDGERIDWRDAAEFELLANQSDWGPRIVGLVGVAALVAAIIVIVVKSA
jgi:hypothetical protein